MTNELDPYQLLTPQEATEKLKVGKRFLAINEQNGTLALPVRRISEHKRRYLAGDVALVSTSQRPLKKKKGEPCWVSPYELEIGITKES